MVCSYNGQRTIRQTLETVTALDYPRYEVIVVNDGSTDSTAAIASEFPDVRLITVPNGGLSAARNVGMGAASGEIIAYIDDDAYPDPHWLHYLARAFRSSNHVAIGGPNIPPPGDGPIAECVANAPGGPIHVLLTDELAEHIPGCNFAVRRDALETIGGFDATYRAAGDDVDACWRLQNAGGTLGFSPAAVVWHHRRNSVKAYWKQQKGYGKAEGLLARKWPEKYNAAGHVSWFGRLYGTGVLRAPGLKSRIYQGTWGSALFQSIYEPAPNFIQGMSQMPEWYVLIAALAALSIGGIAWRPLAFAAPAVFAAAGLSVFQAVASARRGLFPSQPRSRAERLKLQSLTAALFLIQPVARLWGRIGHGLTPWRRHAEVPPAAVRPHVETIWSEVWRTSEDWLERLESHARQFGHVSRGGDYDGWDLQFRGGVTGLAQLLLAVEEHGAGRRFSSGVWNRGSAG